jgi:uncharacterized protein (DUF983 family)
MDGSSADWKPSSRRPRHEPWPKPAFWVALRRGAAGKCPICGAGQAFQGYLRITPHCGHCAAPLGSVRADDAPPYFTIMIVGHIIVPLMLWTERHYAPSVLLYALIFLPLTTALAMALLRPVKGATLGLMMRLGLSDTHDPSQDPPDRR